MRRFAFLQCSLAQQRQVGDLVKAALQGGEQGEAVLLQRRVVAHHHDVGEEGIQRRAEGRQLVKRAAVVAFLQCRVNGGGKRLPALPQRLFGRLYQALSGDGLIAFAVLFQDVADAFGARQ